MKNSFKYRFSLVVDFAANNLHYVGLILLAVMVIQGQRAAQITQQTLSGSVKRQSSVRSILWINLLAQRASVLALNSILTKDPALQEQALDIMKSVPSYLTEEDKQKERQIPLERDMAEIQKILETTLNSEGKSSIIPSSSVFRLTQLVESLGMHLNTAESTEWYNLLADNQSLLEDLKRRQYFSYATYVLFFAYLMFLGWLAKRKKITEVFLKQSERRMRVLAEASFEGLAITKRDRIFEVNPAFEKIFQVKAKEVIGKPVSDFFVSSTRDMASGTVKELIGKKSSLEQIPIEVFVRDSLIENEPIVIVAVRDLTEKKQTESLRLEKEAAEKANRAKSVFLANMSHELRTPMHGVLSFARFGMNDIKKGKKDNLESHFMEIFESGSRLMQLLNDLLDLAKLEAGKMTYTMAAGDLSTLCSHVISEMSAFAAEKQVKVILKMPADLEVNPMMDSDRMMQVVRNIVSNAIKFSDASTEVTIELSKVGEFAQCKVSNIGKGIPQNELELVFDKFVQSSKTRTGAGGTGLGLAICREIISQHNGKLWAESNQQITEFIFQIPLVQISSQQKKIS